jgi:hypothetical protein
MVDLGGGVHLPFRAQQREVYGLGSTFALSYSGRLGSDSWVSLEVGHTRASGREFQWDATFERPEEEYWFVPLVVGLRDNLVPSDIDTPFRFYGGIGLAMVQTGWREGSGASHQAATWGLVFEIRPEVSLAERWNLWVRERASFLAVVDYAGPVSDLNYSGLAAQVGLSFTP